MVRRTILCKVCMFSPCLHGWLPPTVQRHGRLTGDFNWPLMGGRLGVYSKNVFDGHLDI